MLTKLREKMLSRRGERGAIQVEYVFGLVIVIVLITAVIGTIMSNVHDVDTSGWSTAEIALWAVTGIAIVGGIVYKIYRMMFSGK